MRRRPPEDETVLLGLDVDVDECDGYAVLVVDHQLGEVDTYGPYLHAEAEAERLRRRRVLELDALDDVHVQIARFHWPTAHGAARSPFDHECGGSTDPAPRSGTDVTPAHESAHRDGWSRRPPDAETAVVVARRVDGR